MADIDTKFSASLGGSTVSTFTAMQKGLRNIAKELQATAKALMGLQQTEAASAIGHTSLAINKLSFELQKGAKHAKASVQSMEQLAAISKEMAGASRLAQQAWAHFTKEVDAGRMSLGVARARALEYDKALNNLIIDVKTAGGAHKDISKDISFADIAMKQMSGDLQISGGRFRKLSDAAYAYLIPNQKVAQSVKDLHTSLAQKAQALKKLEAIEKEEIRRQKESNRELDKITATYKRLEIQYKTLLTSKTKYGDYARKELQILKEQGTNLDVVKLKLQTLNTAKLNAERIAKRMAAVQRAAQLQEAAAAEQARKAYSSLNAQYSHLIQTKTKYSTQAQKVLNNLKSGIVTIDKARAALSKLNDRFRSNNAGLLLFESGLKRTIRSIKTYISYAATGAVWMNIRRGISGATETIIEADQGLHNLRAITQATTAQVDLLKDSIITVAKDTKFSITETGDTMKRLSQAGFEVNESIAGLPPIANLATGTLESLESTADLTATAVRVFHKTMEDTPEITDIFANAVNKSRLTIGKLNTAFNYITTLAHDAGLSLKQTTASMMLLANSGLRASTIGTGFRRVLVGLLKPTEAFQNAVAEAGYTMEDFNPAYNQWEDILAKLPNVTKNAQDAIKQFGIRGAAVVTAFTSQGVKEFERLSKFVDRTGTASRMAETQMRGLGNIMKNIKDRAGVLAVTIGEGGLADAFKASLSAMRGFMDILISVADSAFGRFVIQAGSVTASMTTFVLVIANAAKVLKLQFVKWLLESTKAALAFAATPLGATLIAIGATIGVVTAALKEHQHQLKETIKTEEEVALKYEKVQNALKDYNDAVSKHGTFSDEAKEAGKKLRDAIDKVGTATKETRAFVDKYSEAIDKNTGAIKDSVAINRELAESVGGNLEESYAKAAKAAKAYYDSQAASRTTKGLVKNAIEGISDLINWHDKLLDKAKERALEKIGVKATTYIDKVGQAYRDLKYNAAQGAGSAIDLLESIQDSASRLAPLMLEGVNASDLNTKAIQDMVEEYARLHDLPAELQGALVEQLSAMATEAKRATEETAKMGTEIQATLQGAVRILDEIEAKDKAYYMVKSGYIKSGLDMITQAAEEEKRVTIEKDAEKLLQLEKGTLDYENFLKEHKARILDIDERALAAQNVLKQKQQEDFLLLYKNELDNVENFYKRDLEIAEDIHKQELLSSEAKYNNELTYLTEHIQDKEQLYKRSTELFIERNKNELKETEIHLSTMEDTYQQAYQARIELAKVLEGDEEKRNDKIEALAEELLEKQKDILEKRRDAYQSTLEKMYSKEQELTAKISSEIEKRRDFDKSVEETLLDLKRKTMTEIEVYQSKLSEAEKLASDARRAYAVGDAETAKEAAKGAIDAYKDAASSIPEQTKAAGNYGLELDDISRKIEGVSTTWRNASDDVIISTKNQKNEVTGFIKKLEEQTAVLTTKIQETTEQLQTLGAQKVELDTSQALVDLQVLDDYLNELTSKQRTVYIDVIRRGSGEPTAEPPGFQTGARIPGYGGGDSVNAMLEPGEWIIRKEAVAKYGDTLMGALNNMLLPKKELPGFATGGSVEDRIKRPSTTPHSDDVSYTFKLPDFDSAISSFKESGKVSDLWKVINEAGKVFNNNLSTIASYNEMAGKVGNQTLGGPTRRPPGGSFYDPSGDTRPDAQQFSNAYHSIKRLYASKKVQGPQVYGTIKGIERLFKEIGFNPSKLSRAAESQRLEKLYLQKLQRAGETGRNADAFKSFIKKHKPHYKDPFADISEDELKKDGSSDLPPFLMGDLSRTISSLKTSSVSEVFGAINSAVNALDDKLLDLHDQQESGTKFKKTIMAPVGGANEYYAPEGRDDPNKGQIAGIISRFLKLYDTGKSSRAVGKYTNGIKELLGLANLKSNAQTKLSDIRTGHAKGFMFGGKVSPASMNFAPAATSGSLSAAPPMVNHLVRFQVGGKVSGGFTAPQSTVDSFVDMLKQAKLRSE